MRRPEPLARTLEGLRGAVEARVEDAGPAAALAARVFDALESPGEFPADPAPATLPVCAHLEPALDAASAAEPRLATLCEAFRSLAPQLAWTRRAESAGAGADFHAGHANAWLIGPAALERHPDVVVGASLLAPGVRYPDHDHPPEELYLVLSEGEWWCSGGEWHAPGVGGLVHHPPGISHAMRAGERPLLAIWCLWTGAR